MKKPRNKLCKRTPAQRQRDVAFCSDLFLKGYSYMAISEKLNKQLAVWGETYTITRQGVFHDIKDVLEEWRNEHKEDINTYVDRELKKLDKIECEAWSAWVNSLGERVRQRLRVDKDKPHQGPQLEEVTKESIGGDPRFLDLLMSVQQRRAKLLGLDAPVKIEAPALNKAIPAEGVRYDISALPSDLLYEVADKLQSIEFERIKKEKITINGKEESGQPSADS